MTFKARLCAICGQIKKHLFELTHKCLIINNYECGDYRSRTGDLLPARQAL